MKKKLIIFRFGSNHPTQKEYTIIDAITGGTQRALWCSSRFGVISIVESEFSPSEITSLFKDVAADESDSLPVIVWDPEGEAGFHLCPQMFINFEETDAEFNKRFGYTRSKFELSLDELLDLVKAKGLDNLSTEELTRLKELSK